MKLARFLGSNRVGRTIVTAIHRAPLHSNWSHPMRFVYDGCWLCNVMVEDIINTFGPTFPDHSRIEYSEPEVADDGTVVKRGIAMTATVERQMKELAETDDARYAALLKAIDEIARNPE